MLLRAKEPQAATEIGQLSPGACAECADVDKAEQPMPCILGNFQTNFAQLPSTAEWNYGEWVEDERWPP
jgi:hypothetical protein